MMIQATKRVDFWTDAATGQPVCFDWRKGGIAEVAAEVAERVIAAGAALALSPTMLAARGALLMKRSKAAGDILMLTPMLAALKEDTPDLEIDFLCGKEFAPLLDGNPALRKVYGLPGEVPNFADYGLVADLDGWPERQTETHVTNRARLCASYFGLELSSTRPLVYVSDEEKAAARKQLRPTKGKLVAVFLDAGWPSRTWPRMREAAGLFSQAGYATLVFGTNHNRAKDWRQLLAMIAACDLVVTADSGPMHAAAALGIPSVAVFLSTDPAAVVGEEYDTTALTGEACVPCWKARCETGDAVCAEELTPAEVYRAGRERLERADSKPSAGRKTRKVSSLASEGARSATGALAGSLDPTNEDSTGGPEPGRLAGAEKAEGSEEAPRGVAP